MIVIAGTIPTKSDRRDEVVAASVVMQTATREEPGCKLYQFSFACEDPALVCIAEEWTDQEALDAHFASPHMAVFQAQIRDLVAGAGSITKYQVESKGPMR